MRLVVRNAWKLKRSSSGSIETMRKGNEKAHRDHAIGKAGPSNLVDVTESNVNDSAHGDHPQIIRLSESDLGYDNQDNHTLPEPEEHQHGDSGITNSPEANILFCTVLSDASMASNSVPAQSRPAASVQPPSEFKTEYHPCSGCPTLFQAFDEFRVPPEAQQVPIDEKPWHPFRSRADFEFSEIALDAALSYPGFQTYPTVGYMD
ncbi:hypothetical protein BD769DRAFT_1684961 [Suillus cothurnatus]|nr:hypothetical protein BD769DRAFT_1684961 [Suillus cothurnatus]